MAKMLRQVRLGVIAAVIIVWTCLPIFHMVMLSLTPQSAAFAGRIWPDNPSLENYQSALKQGHPFLAHFWQQLLNSLLVAFATCALVLFIASITSFALGRLRPRWAPVISNMALFTYLIPAAFLAIPLYRVMGEYGILNKPWSLILALVAFATPYAIWVMRQYAESVPFELDESARVGRGHGTANFLAYLHSFDRALPRGYRNLCFTSGLERIPVRFSVSLQRGQTYRSGHAGALHHFRRCALAAHDGYRRDIFLASDCPLLLRPPLHGNRPHRRRS